MNTERKGVILGTVVAIYADVYKYDTMIYVVICKYKLNFHLLEAMEQRIIISFVFN